MKTPKLKPCPHCGAEAMLVYQIMGASTKLWCVWCQEACSCSIKSIWRKEVIRKWNRRAKS